MRTMRARLVAGLFALLMLSGCSFDIYDLPLPGNQVSADNSFEISADFEDALNVVPRTLVMVGDVPVGQVESVTRVDWHARVTMRISNDVVLPADAQAHIRQTSLLGEKYVELTAPTVPTEGVGQLGDGDVIEMDRSGHNPEVEEVLGALSVVLTGGGVGQLQTITQELNQMMDGRTDEIRGVLRSLNSFVDTLNTQRDDIVRALDSVNGLSATLVASSDTISDALEAAGPAIAVLQDQHAELVAMLAELDELGEVGTRVVNEIKDDLVAGLQHLEPVLRELANAGDSLVPGLVAAASYPFPIDAANVIKGDFANVVFRLQIKLTPVSEGGLIPETFDDIIQLCRGLPTAPICSSLSDGIEQLCSIIQLLPLCTEQSLGEVTAAMQRIEQELGLDAPEFTATQEAPETRESPPAPTLIPELSPGTGGGGGGFLTEFFDALLGGGAP